MIGAETPYLLAGEEEGAGSKGCAESDDVDNSMVLMGRIEDGD